MRQLKFIGDDWITDSNEILPIGTKMIVNMEQMRGELNPRDDRYTYYLMMKDFEGGIYTFVTFSTGGRDAIRNLRNLYQRRVRERRPDCPVITLQAGSYMHRDKSLGRIWVPILKVVDWALKSEFGEHHSQPAHSFSDDDLSWRR